MSHSYSNMLSHVIFSTRDRKPLIDAEMKPRLLGYMNGIVDESGGKVLSLNAMADHLQMLWEAPCSHGSRHGLQIFCRSAAGRLFHSVSHWATDLLPLRS